MSTTAKTGWLHDKNGDKFAPKTLTSQVQTNDGILIEDKIQTDLESVKTYINTKLSELPDPVVNPDVASVGQTLVVKEVDDNGKPTAWESADYQPRTHWSDITTFLPETTIETPIDPEQGVGVGALPDMAIVAGETYHIMYNGVEYVCECLDVGDGILLLGNLEGTTTEPFMIVYGGSEGDDFSRALVTLDGSTSVTLSIIGEVATKIPSRYLPTGVPYEEVVELVPETTPTSVEDGGNVLVIISNVKFIPNETYEIRYAGTKYVCTAFDDDGDVVYVGNRAMITREDTGEPFIMATLPTDAVIMVMPLTAIETPPTVSIIGVKVQKLSARCLPDNVGGLGLPEVSADDNGAILRVVDGAWAITRLPSVEEEGEF